jgi:hypothetical protein
MSTISIAPPGFARLHKAAFDSLGGGTYGVLSFLTPAFLGVAALDAFVVMTVRFYNLRMQRYCFSGFPQKNSACPAKALPNVVNLRKIVSRHPIFAVKEKRIKSYLCRQRKKD